MLFVVHSGHHPRRWSGSKSSLYEQPGFMYIARHTASISDSWTGRRQKR